MKFITVCLVGLIGASFATSAALADASKTPCKDLEKACTDAGFKAGQAGEGSGLWVDCIRPLMKGTAEPAKAKIKLPAVDAATISACKTAHPNFGMGKEKNK